MGKKQNQEFPEIAEAILSGDVKKAKVLLAPDMIFKTVLLRKGKTVCLRTNIPRTYKYNGRELVIYVDAFSFALSNGQKEILKLLIDCGAVDLEPGSGAPFMAIRANDPELFSYLLEKGARIKKTEEGITRLFVGLIDVWDDKWLSILETLELPLKECGGAALCYAAGENHRAAAEYLLSAGVSVNYQEPRFYNTPVLRAVKADHSQMVRLLVEHGADLALRDNEGVRPYLAAKKNHNAKLAEYLREHEPAALTEKALQDGLFQNYHVPEEMAEYLKNGDLRLEFPEEKDLHWIQLYSYADVPEMTYGGKNVLSLVEDSGEFNVMLVWESQSEKIWFIDMEHEIFHAVSTWQEFIKNAGRYINRAVMWDFD